MKANKAFTLSEVDHSFSGKALVDAWAKAIMDTLHSRSIKNDFLEFKIDVIMIKYL